MLSLKTILRLFVMKVIEKNAALLSNYEVWDILKSIKGNKKHQTRNQLATITYETLTYLEETICKQQTPEIIRNLMVALKPFKLTKCEKLTILNLCPRTACEMQLIIEDSEERISEDEIQTLLGLVATHLNEHANERELTEEEN